MVTIPQNVADAIDSFKKDDSTLNNVFFWAYGNPEVSERALAVYNYIKQNDKNLNKFIEAYTKGYKIKKPEAPYYNNKNYRIGVCFNYALVDMDNKTADENRLFFIKLGEAKDFRSISNSISRDEALNISKTLKDLVDYYDKYFS